MEGKCEISLPFSLITELTNQSSIFVWKIVLQFAIQVHLRKAQQYKVLSLSLSNVV